MVNQEFDCKGRMESFWLGRQIFRFWQSYDCRLGSFTVNPRESCFAIFNHRLPFDLGNQPLCVRSLLAFEAKLIRGVTEGSICPLNEEVVKLFPHEFLDRSFMIRRVRHKKLPQLIKFFLCSESFLVCIASEVTALIDIVRWRCLN